MTMAMSNIIANVGWSKAIAPLVFQNFKPLKMAISQQLGVALAQVYSNRHNLAKAL